jgi:hypothetical protein
VATFVFAFVVLVQEVKNGGRASNQNRVIHGRDVRSLPAYGRTQTTCITKRTSSTPSLCNVCIDTVSLL